MRKNNLIVSGVPMVSGDLEARKEADRAFLVKLHDCLDVKEPNVEDFRRIGRPGHQQLLRVRYRERATRISVLRKARTLRYSEVFKNADLTLLQQNEQRKLRQELQQRRQDGENVIIFRNNVIDRSKRPIFF